MYGRSLKIRKACIHIMRNTNVAYAVIKESRFTKEFVDAASKVLICKKMVAQTMKPESIVIKEIDDKFYQDKDYHVLYICGITQILRR